ncbi:MAG: Thiol:disulfide interchange protein DsbD [Verrucomicrobiae bacterium]|nr:Thiol:disulfide interchange protein DsbD [Verrucomicrobiae bacterium]
MKWLGLWLALVASVTAQDIRVTGHLSHDKLSPGQSFRIAVVLELPEPWHCNANPASEEDFIPTTLSFAANKDVSFGKIRYPVGKTVKVSWAEKPVALYSGKVIIFADAQLAANATGPVTIEGTLRYQACDDQVCYAPKSVPVSVTAEVGTGQPVAPEIFGALPAEEPNRLAELVSERGWFIAVVVVFFSGLALNLTPCVYPMIAITVSYFGAQKGRSRRQAFAGAVAYCLGIVVTYSVLGVIAALTGGLFGALLQSQWVLLGIAGLLVVLALSMFGLYEIRPPSFLVQRAAGMSSRAGYLGVFFLGATLGIVAAPCLAPFAVALLAYVGATREWWWFLVFASGLAIPYLILGTFSGLLSQLPKSGTWMVWVKRVFGTALLAVAIWFAWPVLGPKTKSESPIAWQPYSPAAVKAATAAGRPVIIDFFADWCIPCREMDRETFMDPQVAERSKDFVMLKADLTRTGSPVVEELTQDFRIRGVPTFVFLDAAGKEHAELRQIGFVTIAKFLALMEKAKLPAGTNSVATSPVPPELMRPF